MMKKLARVIAVVVTLSLFMAGCGKKGHVSTSELRSNFKSAAPDMQTLVNKVVSALNSNNYNEAVDNLQALDHKAKLTVEQRQAIKDTITRIEQAVADAAKKSAADAQKAAAGKPK